MSKKKPLTKELHHELGALIEAYVDAAINVNWGKIDMGEPTKKQKLKLNKYHAASADLYDRLKELREDK